MILRREIKLSWLFLIAVYFYLNTVNVHGQPHEISFPFLDFDFEIINHQSLASNNYYLLTPSKIEHKKMEANFLVMLDNHGHLKWWYKNPTKNYINFQFHPIQNVYSFTQFGGNEAPKVILLDTHLKAFDTINTMDPVIVDIHAFEIASNGNYIISGIQMDTITLKDSLYSYKGPGDYLVLKGFVVQEIDHQDQLVFSWNSNDHIDYMDFEKSYLDHADPLDYCHGNSISEDLDGHLLISFRHLDAVYKIDRKTGAIKWVLGGKSNQFTMDEYASFSGQHDAAPVSQDVISLFDNANFSTQQQSKPKLLRIDTTQMTCTLVWEFPSTIFANAMGNFQFRQDSLKVIGYGSAKDPYPSIICLDQKDQYISEIFIPDSITNYKAELVELTTPFPEIRIEKITRNQITYLKGPDGYHQYIWNNGDKGQIIEVNHKGTYQVWVNYGIGMIGSEPIQLSLD